MIDEEHLARMLVELYNDRNKLKQLGDVAYTYVHQELFTWEYVASQFNMLIENAIASSRVTARFKSK